MSTSKSYPIYVSTSEDEYSNHLILLLWEYRNFKLKERTWIYHRNITLAFNVVLRKDLTLKRDYK